MRKSNNLEQTYRLSLKQIPMNLLSQTIQLLGLPLAEFETEIKQELEDNPLLEMEEDTTLITTKSIESGEDSIDETDTNLGEISDTYEISRLKEFESTSRRSYEKTQVFENNFSTDETLQEHLLFQARLDIADERLFTLASYIIYEIDDDGYFKGDISTLKKVEGYEFTEEEIEKVRERIKTYDPVGCGSRTLEENLISQLENFYPNLRNIDTYKRIIENDLELLAKDSRFLSSKYGLSKEEVEELRLIVKSLSPKPGVNFSKSPSFIVPEAVIRKTDDSLEVEFNDNYIPRLRIKKEYIEAVKKSGSKELKDKIVKAKSIILAIEYRKNILRSIIEKIIEHQRDFLLDKQNFLNPLLIEDIAGELGVTISTVSRAIKDKYILTPVGLVPIKYFFSRSGKSVIGEEVSVDRIKKLIDTLVKNEGDKPLSDDKIANILKNKGIKIARRTVTKYRESMGIPPAHLRKKR
ncbi:MAG: RNA polymerase factor sigma-54 [Spirochaetia bacterium]|nr:RNA polymerase factor sigma-54 [Spirochaetota bacterium]MCX8096455.1 RNA polymerase factor sigma-54 [Spirochaetota bacterium]MDW8112741.1 RNA polymerase factor sigma-54 [Spirochaetia bacterium]